MVMNLDEVRQLSKSIHAKIAELNKLLDQAQECGLNVEIGRKDHINPYSKVTHLEATFGIDPRRLEP